MNSVFEDKKSYENHIIKKEEKKLLTHQIIKLYRHIQYE